MAADYRETRVIENGAAAIAGTKDSALVQCRGARSVNFIFTSTESAVYAAANAFQLIVETAFGEAQIINPTTPANHGLAIQNAASLNGAAANAGIVVQVRGVNGDPIAVRRLGCRVTAGAVALADIECLAVVIY